MTIKMHKVWFDGDNLVTQEIQEDNIYKREPVAWMYVNQDGECEQIEYEAPPDDPSVTPLYTTPPQRQWVGLTDEDRQELAAEQHSWEGLCFAVEAKLKEKNGG